MDIYISYYLDKNVVLQLLWCYLEQHLHFTLLR